MTVSKISIENRQGEKLVGILEEKSGGDRQGKPQLAIICHGVLGHKDYLFHRLLAEKLPFSSFRFDFRGNGESEGEAGYANMAEDAEDVDVVAKYFEGQGYEIFTLIGHSRGAVAVLKYAATCEKPVPHVVNISGRYKMNDNQIYKSRPEIGESLDKQGYFDWSVKQRDRIVQIKVTQKEVDRFTSWDNSYVSHIPKATCVLTCHGVNDTIVPAYNAAMYANQIPNHTLYLIPDADHTFKGKFEELVDKVVGYFEKHKNPYEREVAIGQRASVCLPRWIDIEGVRNFRDIGGWSTKDGLTAITEKGIKALKALNVTAIFDFRSDLEIQRYGIMKEVPGITLYPTPIFKDSDWSPAELVKKWETYFVGINGFVIAYMDNLTAAGPHYGKIIKHIIGQQSPSGLVIHCSAGKDRTGLFAMLVLGLCGVEDDIIAEEYSYTSRGFWESEKQLQAKCDFIGVSMERMKFAMSTLPEVMKATIKAVRDRYGSLEGYAQQECGLTGEEIRAFRERMIVPVRFEQRQLFRL
ncbi:hypothetical protein EC973_006657 [Apophysomyces ossiformis]|uniref:Tyrosine specific protein phosphatases domain-containing protein n=1 Tax=Apophysomyces ossiformis TaxID=679940 RepID=A0A8H7BV22_9FUNG|nr:hypothetical protein EC973_006657 [Apophysomyces ossiformis]